MRVIFVCVLVSLAAVAGWGDVDYVAHQGEERLAPSHSRPAYRFAAEHGLDYLKLDVRETKDGEVVLQHDATLKATMNWDVRISSLTLQEIREKGRHRPISIRYREAYTNETIVTLPEALEIAKTGIRKGLWVDFKHFTPRFAEKVFDILGQYGYGDDKVMVATFDKKALRWVQENRPRVRRVAHTVISLQPGGFKVNADDPKAELPDETALVEALDAHGKKYGLHGFNLPAPMGRGREGWNTTPFVIQELKKRGYWISIWFVNNSACGVKYRDLADAFVTNCKADTFPAQPALVPLPRELQVNDGALELEAQSIEDLPIQERTARDLPKEGYRLVVNERGIRVAASAPAGFFYARQTLRQLAVRNGRTLRVPFVEIKDQPAYAWRGLMLDEGRHFFGRETVKRILDRMAAEKLNVFHWHLTEDQGWRIALDRFPELEKYATVRAESVSRDWTHANKVKDGKRYGPYFYTRAELEDVVAYARERFIEVVPEVELPGHARAALAAYPEFSCLGDQLQPREAWSDIGVCPEVFCAGNDDALKFLEAVLDEICDIFPSKSIHFGGDECPKTRWRACAKCQRRVHEEGLEDVEALQGWMTRRFAAYLAKKGRTAIGWHEILSGGADPRTTVIQNWRKPSIGVSAATNGFRVIQSPYLETYFSFPQGLGAKDPYTYRSPGHQLTLEKAYRFDPAAGLSDRTNLLGSECCLWTEMVFDEKEAFWKLWPRASAFAEVVWTASESRDFKDFQRRCQVP